MSLVNVTSVEVRNNPSGLNASFAFDVVFECLEDLQTDLEWKLTYVGSADDKTLDQELDCVVMGPIHRGALKFTFEADPPDFSKIPPEDIHGFTIILLTGSYREEEFIRIGWYVHNFYVDQDLQDDPPDIADLSRMQRIILTEAPRVTRFKISWDKPRFDECSLSTKVLDTIDECDDTTIMTDAPNGMQDVLSDTQDVPTSMSDAPGGMQEFPSMPQQNGGHSHNGMFQREHLPCTQNNFGGFQLEANAVDGFNGGKMLQQQSCFYDQQQPYSNQNMNLQNALQHNVFNALGHRIDDMGHSQCVVDSCIPMNDVEMM